MAIELTSGGTGGGVETLTDAEKGRLAFDFIDATVNGLPSEFDRQLRRDFFNPYVQQTPRRYGTLLRFGDFSYRIKTFTGHSIPEDSNRRANLEIHKFRADVEKDSEAFMGHIDVDSYWTEINGVKIFESGSGKYRATHDEWPGNNDLEYVLSQGHLLVAELVSPVVKF